MGRFNLQIFLGFIYSISMVCCELPLRWASQQLTLSRKFGRIQEQEWKKQAYTNFVRYIMMHGGLTVDMFSSDL